MSRLIGRSDHMIEPTRGVEMNDIFRKKLFEDYTNFKGWHHGATPNHEIYEKELSRCGKFAHGDFLEIGFGEGHFLDWAQKKGFRTCGIEIIAELVAAARANGHDVYQGALTDIDDLHDRTFDLIVAFDVLEHLTPSEILRHLEVISLHLKSTGKVLARFPNGASPFGRVYQYGDMTHVTGLTPSRLHQLALIAGLRVTASYNSARVVRGSGLGSSLVRRLAYLLRDAVGLFISSIYFGKSLPMDPNVTVILERNP